MSTYRIVTKTVALSDRAYDALARLKRPGQSFSEVVQELAADQRPSVREVSGLLAHDSAYWQAFAAKRRGARRLSARRVHLEGD
jgi:predicted CopG family antitoxin